MKMIQIKKFNLRLQLSVLVLIARVIQAQLCDVQIVVLSYRENCEIGYRNCPQLGFAFQGCEKKYCARYDFQQRKCLEFNLEQTQKLSQMECAKKCCLQHSSQFPFTVQSLTKCQQDQTNIIYFNWKSPATIVVMVVSGIAILSLLSLCVICITLLRRSKNSKQNSNIKLQQQNNSLRNQKYIVPRSRQNQHIQDLYAISLRKQRMSVPKLNTRSHLTSIKLTKPYDQGYLKWTQILQSKPIFEDWHTCQVCSRLEPEVQTACRHYYHINCILLRVQGSYQGSGLCLACSKKIKGRILFVCMKCKQKVKKVWVTPEFTTAKQVIKRVGTNICRQCFHKR